MLTTCFLLFWLPYLTLLLPKELFLLYIDSMSTIYLSMCLLHSRFNVQISRILIIAYTCTHTILTILCLSYTNTAVLSTFNPGLSMTSWTTTSPSTTIRKIGLEYHPNVHFIQSVSNLFVTWKYLAVEHTSIAIVVVLVIVVISVVLIAVLILAVVAVRSCKFCLQWSVGQQ